MKQLIILLLFFNLSGPGLLPGNAPAEELKGGVEIDKMLSKAFNLSDILKYAYGSNPSITASKESWQAFIENYRIEKTYPDPQLMTTYFPKPIETRLGPQDWNLTLTQTIPFPGTLSQKGKVLEADVRISKLKVDKTIKAIVTSATSSYYELVYIQRAIEIAKANMKINQQLMAMSENAYAKDKALFYDLSKARAQTAQIRYDIILLEELEQTEKTKINTLLNRPPDAALGRAAALPPKTVVYSLQEIYALCSHHQEDILIADEGVQKSEEAIRLTRYDNFPTFKFGLFYAGIGDPDLASPPKDAGDDALGVQLGLTLPLWFGKNQSRTAKAKAINARSKADKLVITNRIRAKISRIWFKLQNSGRLITLYEKELLPQALASVQTADTWFREGQGSFSDYLEIQSTAYNFQLSLERARADYGKNLVLLEQLAGVILDRKIPGSNDSGTSR